VDSQEVQSGGDGDVSTPLANSFSVVTPNFNMDRFLGETIESVLRNLRAGDEYLIIDGGSTDESIQTIRSYETRLTGWVSEPDSGYPDALRKGFARSRGQYQCWINSGDLLLDGALEVAREQLETTGADFIFGDDFYVDESGTVLGFSKGHARSLRNSMLFGGWTPLQDACFWRSDLYNRVGGIDGTLEYSADYDLFLKFSVLGKCAYVPLAFGAFRKHEGQQSIVEASRYAGERERCRSRMLEVLGISRSQKSVFELYYWIATRFRGHVLYPMWNIKSLVGASVQTLRAQAYR
jgi:glycosyltransferase involved in cell wall biosynthesis